MANVDVKLSAAAWGVLFGGTPAGQRDLGALIETFGKGSLAASQAAMTGASWTLLGDALRVDFGNGANLQYTGVTIPSLTALSGTAHATGMSFYQNGVLSMSQSGQYDVGYSLAGGMLNLTSITGLTTGGHVATLVPYGSSQYDPMLGNISVAFEGRLGTDANGSASGEITRISASADALIGSLVIEGSFGFAGNLSQIGAHLQDAALAGTLTSLRADFHDGSHAWVNGAIAIGAADTIDSAFLDGSKLSGDDVLSFLLPDNVTRDIRLDAGTGNDAVTVGGGSGRLQVAAGAGNDVVTVASGAHAINGGAGVDTVRLAGMRESYKVAIGADTTVVTGGDGSHQLLTQVERIAFADGSVALDLDGHAGQSYRLYQATFNRVPDLGGEGYWIRAMDSGMSLQAVAQHFIDAPEFTVLYGQATDSAFVTALYANALHRTPDQGGLDYHLASLKDGLSRAQLLINFSESPENQAQVIGAISAGITYL